MHHHIKTHLIARDTGSVAGRGTPDQWQGGGQGSSKRIEGNGNLQKAKHGYRYPCFCSVIILTSKTVREILENPSETSGCANSCNN